MTTLLPTTIPHSLPAPALEVVPALLVGQIQAAVADAATIQITDAASFESANALVVRLHQIGKDVENHGENIKKPLNQLLKSVRECLDRAATPVAESKRKIQGQIAAWQKEQQRIADEARAKAEADARAAREAAEAERKRLQEEADAKAKADAEELAAILGQPVEPEKVVVEMPNIAPIAPIVPLDRSPVTKSQVVTRTVQTLEIYDESVVPTKIGDIELRPIDRAAVKRAIDAGLVVPGAHMVAKEQVSMARGAK